MPIPITMPRLSDTMEQGTVVKWNVKVGDKVSAGDVLADIETDKATMELQSFDSGTVAALAAQEGQQVSVGAAILILAEEGESVEAAAGSGGASAPAKKSEGGSDAKPAASATAVAAPPPQPPQPPARMTPTATPRTIRGSACSPRRWPARSPRNTASTSRP